MVQREDVHNTSLIPGQDKYILEFRHKFQNLVKYVLKFGPTLFSIRPLYQPSWFKGRRFIILLLYYVKAHGIGCFLLYLFGSPFFSSFNLAIWSTCFWWAVGGGGRGGQRSSPVSVIYGFPMIWHHFWSFHQQNCSLDQLEVDTIVIKMKVIHSMKIKRWALKKKRLISHSKGKIRSTNGKRHQKLN